MLIEELLGGSSFDYDDVLGAKFPIFEMSVEGFINNNETLIYSMTLLKLTNLWVYLWDALIQNSELRRLIGRRPTSSMLVNIIVLD
mgnify:CR=1 FL=1